MRFKKTLIILTVLTVLSSSLGMSQYFGKNKVTYDDFEWKIYKTPHFDVFYYPEEEHLLNTLVQWLESSYIYVAKTMNWTLRKRTPVFFYKTYSEFEQTHIYPAFLPPGVGAFAEPSRNRFVIPLDEPPAEMKRLITHELTHIFQFDMLFNNSLPQRILSNPPGWVMEGLAEHTALGYDTMDEMYIRDFAARDAIPPITALRGGYLSDYVLGQTIFDYILEQYNRKTFQAFLMHLRNRGSSRRGVANAFKEILKTDLNEFSRKWQKYLRDKYVPYIIEKKEAGDYGKPLSFPSGLPVFNPVISPSGDLIAILTVDKQDVDIALISSKTGRLIKNLTPGFSNDYRYIIGSLLTNRFHGSRDIGWSPDGNSIVFIGRTGKDRTIFIIDAYTGKIKHRYPLTLNAVLTPAFSHDGKAILFAANKDGIRDIFKVDILSGKISNVTKDAYFDYAPVPSSDGKYLYYTSDRNGNSKIFRMVLATKEKEQFTFGDWDDYAPSLNKTEDRLLFISDETGIFNVYELDLKDRTRIQHTDLMGGAFYPQYKNSTDEIVYTYFSKRRFTLYNMKLQEPVRITKAKPGIQPEDTDRGERLSSLKNLGRDSVYLPPKKLEKSKEEVSSQERHSFYIDDAFINGGLAPDGTLLTYSYFQFADITSSIRFRVMFATIGSYRNLGLTFTNISKRLNWGFSIFDSTYYFRSNLNFGGIENPILDRLVVEQIGATIFGNYPLSLYTRLEFSAGYLNRDYRFPPYFQQQIAGDKDLIGFKNRFISGSFAPVSVALVHDSTRYASFGALAGTRFRINASYGLGLDSEIGSYGDVGIDYRDYQRLSERIVFATRLVGKHSFGDANSVFIFGGTDTLRGYDYLQLAGNTVFYGNFELRFPLVDRIDIPIGMRLSGIRGQLFFNIGGAFFRGENFEFFEEGSIVLKDATASYGGGLSMMLLGLEIHWDAARITNLRDAGDWVYSFWIGYSF